jgi:hypothetical protein
MTANVGTIGHVDHGRTTLTAALCKVLGAEIASQVVIVDDANAADFARNNPDFDGLAISEVSPFGSGRAPNAKRKAERKARLKTAQLNAFAKAAEAKRQRRIERNKQRGDV